MSTISVEKYIDGIESIYVEQPSYQTGHDGSDGLCDCIGMCRGALKRGGATDVKNMRGTNQAARKTIQNLMKIESSAILKVGQVVMKVRDKDDPSMPLPAQYRKGGSDYDPTWGEINFTHIGTVTQNNPLIITHMTSPSAKQDKSIKGWSYVGDLPYVSSEPSPGPGPEPQPVVPDAAIVTAEKGDKVKMRAKPSLKCSLYWEVRVGSRVAVYEWGDEWSNIAWNGIRGYMLTKFLRESGGNQLYVVTVPHLTLYEADALIERYPGAYKELERG